MTASEMKVLDAGGSYNPPWMGRIGLTSSNHQELLPFATPATGNNYMQVLIVGTLNIIYMYKL